MRLPGGRKPTLKKLEGYDNGQQFQLSVFTINLAVESEEALDVLLRGIPSVKLYGYLPDHFSSNLIFEEFRLARTTKDLFV